MGGKGKEWKGKWHGRGYGIPFQSNTSPTFNYIIEKQMNPIKMEAHKTRGNYGSITISRPGTYSGDPVGLQLMDIVHITNL